jgi:hypothetical protein
MSGEGWKANLADACMGQGFPDHVVIDAGGAIGGEDGGDLWQLVAKAIVEVVVGNFPSRMLIEFQMLRHRGRVWG